MCNRALAAAGVTTRVDHRSHAERGLTIPAQRSLSYVAWRRDRVAAAAGLPTASEAARTNAVIRSQITDLRRRDELLEQHMVGARAFKRERQPAERQHTLPIGTLRDMPALDRTSRSGAILPANMNAKEAYRATLATIQPNRAGLPVPGLRDRHRCRAGK